MAEISVIVPVYKVEQFLNRCVDSILGQSFSDFELILVDDGSPDHCGEMCDIYARKDSRIHVIHQENGGLSAARNAGIDWVFANSESQWLTFIDSDDWVHRDYLRTMYDAAKTEGCAIVMCGFYPTATFVTDTDLSQSKVACYSAEDAYVQHYWLCMHAWGKILHRNIMSQIRFPRGKLYEDVYVTHLLLFQTSKVAVCDSSLYYYYSNPNSITRVQWSERRLDQIEGHERRLAYLLEHGYTRAYCSELKAYTDALFFQTKSLRELSREDDSYRSYLRMLHPKMVATFRQARKMKVIPYRENIWIYEVAYPIKPIWALRNLFVKLFSKTTK